MHSKLFRIGTDRTACDPVIARALMRLTDKIDFERRGVLLFFFLRVPLDVFYDIVNIALHISLKNLFHCIRRFAHLIRVISVAHPCHMSLIRYSV